jgi:hypothetical protein
VTDLYAHLLPGHLAEGWNAVNFRAVLSLDLVAVEWMDQGLPTIEARCPASVQERQDETKAPRSVRACFPGATTERFHVPNRVELMGIEPTASRVRFTSSERIDAKRSVNGPSVDADSGPISEAVASPLPPASSLLERLADLVRDAVVSGDVGLARALLDAQTKSAAPARGDVVSIVAERDRRRR